MKRLPGIRIVIRLDGDDQGYWALEGEEDQGWSILVSGTSPTSEDAFEAAMGAWGRCRRTGMGGKWAFSEGRLVEGGS